MIWKLKMQFILHNPSPQNPSDLKLLWKAVINTPFKASKLIALASALCVQGVNKVFSIQSGTSEPLTSTSIALDSACKLYGVILHWLSRSRTHLVQRIVQSYLTLTLPKTVIAMDELYGIISRYFTLCFHLYLLQLQHQHVLLRSSRNVLWTKQNTRLSISMRNSRDLLNF